MTLRTNPDSIARLSGEIDTSTSRLKAARPAPGADAGPSTAAVTTTVAQLMRAAAGLAETTAKTADDLQANKTTYANVEDHNTGLFNRIQPR